MLQQKQGARVRISSQEKVINMSEEYFPSDSRCSCLQCDSIACFKIRNINSEIPCTCTYCNPNTCLTWEIDGIKSKPKNEMKDIKVSPEILKNLLNVSETKLKTNTSDTNKCIEHPTNTTNATNATKKEKISFSYLDNDFQKDKSDDHELKEVYTTEKNHIGKCGIMGKIKDDKNTDEFENKDSSSNEKSDVIEYNAIQSDKSHSNDTETKQVSTKYGSDIKKSCRKNHILEQKNVNEHERSNDITNKYLSSQPETKELFTNKNRKCCSRNILIDNTKTNGPEVYKIFTNEKKNIVKCCIISKDLEKKNTDISVNKQDNPENEVKYLKENCKETKVLHGNKSGTTEPNLEIKTKITNIKCNHEHPIKPKTSDVDYGNYTKYIYEDISHTKNKMNMNNKSGTTEPNLEIKTKITNIKCNHEDPIKPKTSDVDYGNYTKYIYEDISHTKNKMNMNKNIKSYEKYVSRLQSVAISYGREGYENSRAELSAQVMNVPYKDFKESLSRKPSFTDSNTCNSSSNLEKMDIFTRLKEIYKACSCKVCECIAGKSLFNRTEVCKCEPCDCNDCNGYIAKLKKRITYTPHSGCPCVSCDRKDCRGVVKTTNNYTACDCKPCDCVRCTESFTKPCSCTPCECETCKTSIISPQTLMVANVAESLRQSKCDCEPCECANCTSSCSEMTLNLIREVSTGMIAYGNCNFENSSDNTCQLGGSDCRCNSQHKVITKPMAEKRSDYGIQQVYIKENKYKKKTVTNNNHNTITMLALSNNYPNRLLNYSNKKQSCECDICECIVCKDKGKGTITNKSLKIDIDNPKCGFNTYHLNSYKCSPCACQSCKSLNTENFDQKLFDKTGYDTCNCTNSKKLGYNLKRHNNNENCIPKDKVKLTNSEFENKCQIPNNFQYTNQFRLYSQDFKDTDEGNLQDNEKIFLLKKGKLLTPSMFENNEFESDSSHLHIKPEKDGLRENVFWGKNFTKEYNTQLFYSKSHHNNTDIDYNHDVTYKIQKRQSAIKVISTNSSLMNMVSKEVEANEIYKTNSIDFRNSNVSKTFFEHSKDTVLNDDSNILFIDTALTQMIAKPSSNIINKKLEYEYNKDINQSSNTPLVDKQGVEDFFYNTTSSSNNDVHFSSAKSMSLVKLLCKERNLNVDNKFAIKILQSLEKFTLKNLKMDEEDESYTCDKTLNDDVFFDSSTKDNCNFYINNNLTITTSKNLESELTIKKIDKCNDKNQIKIHDKDTIKVPVSKRTKQVKSKAVSNLEMFEKKPYNYNTKAKGSAAQFKTNKPRSQAKVLNSHLRSKTETNLKGNVNKINNKRHLEIPQLIDTATSSINFKESDKSIDLERSFKLLRDLNFNIDENQKENSILRKNFFMCPEIIKNKGMSSIPLLKLDVANSVKSISLQTNTISPYSLGIDFGNKALTKLQTEVNDLLSSPFLQSSFISSTAKSWSKNKLNLDIKNTMRDATLQTKRNTIVVDKEMNCNIFQSRENLNQSIQNFINMTLTHVVQHTDMESRKLNLLKDFNNVSSLNVARSSCDGLRVGFVGLRKVSDHSVLLRWAMPRDLSHIQGYELQVDGRPVQKILNPSRCIAVLTCLPHYEKLLLTIRTITNLETSHNPVTTIVYNPKKNKSDV